jgi:hypothetical protein
VRPVDLDDAGKYQGRGSADEVPYWYIALSAEPPSIMDALLYAYDETPTDLPDGTTEALTEFFQEVHWNYDRVFKHFIDLVGSAQKKMMKVENIDSYFASQDMPISNVSLIVTVVMGSSRKLKPLIDSEYISEEGAQNLWLVYRTRTFSAAHLCLQFYDSHPDLGIRVFPNGREWLVEIADNADDLTMSFQITNRQKMITYAFLSANSCLPDDWYQGEKAWDSAPVGDKRGWLNLFKADADRKKAATLGDGQGLVEAAVENGFL